jgi:two-component system response regulator HydG
MEKLVKYNWPGNVRELMNAVERAVVLSRTTFLDADELSLMMADSPLANESDKPCMTGNLPLDEVEKRSILEALDTCGGNKSEAARRLGITRKTLRKKLERYEQGGC